MPHPIAFLVMPRVWRATPLHPLLHRRIGSIPLNLARPDVGALRRALATLRTGAWSGIFPEGPFSVRGPARARPARRRAARAAGRRAGGPGRHSRARSRRWPAGGCTCRGGGRWPCGSASPARFALDSSGGRAARDRGHAADHGRHRRAAAMSHARAATLARARLGAAGSDGRRASPARWRSISGCGLTTSRAAWRGPARWRGPACSPMPSATAIVAGLDDGARRAGGRHVPVPARARGHPHERGAAAPGAGGRGRRQAAHRPLAQRPDRARRAALPQGRWPRAPARRCRAVQRALVARAAETVDTPMPGYTHMQRAQPIVLAHHLLAYVFMLQRDRERFAAARRARRRAAARRRRARRHGLPDRSRGARPRSRLRRRHARTASTRSAIATTSLEYLAAAAITGMHLSRLAADLALWATAEFGFVEFSDAFATGSSIMPQKKNPDVAELIRGKSGRLYGNLMAVLTVMKGLPLAYNSDMQEDKEAFFDSVDTLAAIVGVLPPMLASLTLPHRAHAHRGRRELRHRDRPRRLPGAQGPAVPRRPRDRGQGRAATRSSAASRLEQLDLEELRRFSDLFGRRRPRGADRRGLAARPHRRTAAPRPRPCGSRARSGSRARARHPDAGPAAGRWRWRRVPRSALALLCAPCGRKGPARGARASGAHRRSATSRAPAERRASSWRGRAPRRRVDHTR